MKNKEAYDFLYDNGIVEFLDDGEQFDGILKSMEEYAEYQIKKHLEIAAKRALIVVKDVDGDSDEGREFNLAFAGDSTRANVTISEKSITKTPIEL